MQIAKVIIEPLYIDSEDLSDEELDTFNSLSDEEKITFIKTLVDDFILDTSVELIKEE